MPVEEAEQGLAFGSLHALGTSGEGGAPEDALASGDGMGAHHGRHRLFVLLELLRLLRVGDRAKGTTVVDGAKVREQPLHAVRERLVGGVHAGPEGVATGVGDRHRVQHRTQGRAVLEGHVAVPGIRQEGPPLVALEDHDLRMPFVLARGDHRMDVEGTEAARKGLVGLRVQRSIAKDDHLMLEPGALDLREGFVVEGLGQVHSADLGAERGRRGGARDRHQQQGNGAFRPSICTPPPQPGRRGRWETPGPGMPLATGETEHEG